MATVRHCVIIILAVLFSLALTVVGNAQTPKRGGTLIVGTAKDPHGLDPHKDVATQGITILKQIYDSLLNINDEGAIIPGLAESTPSQPDPVTYVFTLRRGVKFHNGADFDAQDVKFSFDRLMSREISLYWKTYEGLIKSVEIMNPYKVKLTLARPNVVFLDMVAKYPEMHIVPRSSGTMITHPNGTGPFKFKEWIRDDRLVLVRNESYWEKGLPYLDQIIYKPFPEEAIRVINLKTGNVDLVHNLPVADAIELKRDPRIKIMGRSGGLTEQIWINTTKPPFDNKKVRQAFAYGIDRQAIAESVFMGYAEVADDLFPSWHWAHNPNVKSYPYNPERARALLREAGYSDKNPFSFTLSCNNEKIYVDQSVIIQAQLAKIGVKVNVEPQEKSFWFDALLGRNGRDYEASLQDTADEMTDLQWAYRFFSSKSYYNNTGYNSERYGKKGAQNLEIERIFDEVVKMTDKSRTRKMWDDAQRMILDDLPILRLSYYQNIIAMRDYVKNHKILTRNFVPLKGVWVEK